MDFRLARPSASSAAAEFVARVVGELEEVPLPGRDAAEHQRPGRAPQGVEVTRLGKRIYRDELKLHARTRPAAGAIGSTVPIRISTRRGHRPAAVAAGRIAVTPVHFDLTHVAGLDVVAKSDLSRLLAPPTPRGRCE